MFEELRNAPKALTPIKNKSYPGSALDSSNLLSPASKARKEAKMLERKRE